MGIPEHSAKVCNKNDNLRYATPQSKNTEAMEHCYLHTQSFTEQ